MARQARGEVLDPNQVQIVHAQQRCVRQAYLCGKDSQSGRSFEHRRTWIRDRMELLSGAFGIDILTFAVMHNHLHVVLRSRPDVVKTWSDREVARRWLKLFGPSRGESSEVEPQAIDALVRDKSAIIERRVRLSDISWWMRSLAEAIARQANTEDECKGRFWEGRFKAQVLLDDSSILACAAYVDLNPIRAAIARSLGESQFTGLHERLQDLTQRDASVRSGTYNWERSDKRLRSGWLSPIELGSEISTHGADVCKNGRRTSQSGFLAMSLTEYISFVDWTGRQLRGDKRGSIPSDVLPLLDRLGLDEDRWCRLVREYRKTFRRVAGTVENIAAEADRRGLHWMHAPGNPLSSVA